MRRCAVETAAKFKLTYNQGTVSKSARSPRLRWPAFRARLGVKMALYDVGALLPDHAQPSVREQQPCLLVLVAFGYIRHSPAALSLPQIEFVMRFHRLAL